MHLPRSWILIAILSVAGVVSAQEAGDSAGVIVYADGAELTIIRGGRQIRLDAASGEAFGEPVYAGDQISTDNATYAEIQLLASRTIVKVSENTTFRVRQLSGSGESRLELAYGRLRSRVERLAGVQSFEVRGLTAVAGVRGTDFTFDQLLEPATGAIVEQVATFDGEVIVERPDVNELTVVGAGEMAVVSSTPDAPPLAVEAIPDEVVSYWSERDFVAPYREPEELLDDYPSLRETFESSGLVISRTPQTGTASSEEVLPSESASPSSDSTAPATGESPGGAASDGVDGGGADRGRLAVRVETADEEAAGTPDSRRAPTEQIVTEPVDGERGVDTSRILGVTGVTLAAVGLTTDIVAVVLYFSGDNLFSGWGQEQTDLMAPIGGIGLGVLASGLLVLLVSTAF